MSLKPRAIDNSRLLGNLITNHLKAMLLLIIINAYLLWFCKQTKIFSISADGPLYAVSNLNARTYSGIPETQNNQNSDSARSSPDPEIVPHDEPGEIPKENQHVIYQRYLSPIEGVPSLPSSVSSVAKEGENETYVQPIDELRASKRFLERSRNRSPEPEVAYLEPLHGIPVPVRLIVQLVSYTLVTTS